MNDTRALTPVAAGQRAIVIGRCSELEKLDFFLCRFHKIYHINI